MKINNRADRTVLVKLGQKSITVLTMSLILALVAGLLTACGTETEVITSPEQLNREDAKIGVATDAPEFALVEERFPKAEVVYTQDLIAAFTSVAQGKMDAYVGNKLNMELAIYNGLQGVRLLDGTIGEGNVSAVAISPRTEIPDLKGKINEFLKQVKEDGTLDDMRSRWMDKRDMAMPTILEAKDRSLTL